MATLVMIFSGLLGFFSRRGLDRARPAAKWWPYLTGCAGGFALGALTGVALTGLDPHGPLVTAGVGSSAALTTYCVFGRATTALPQVRGTRAVLVAAAQVGCAFVAATAGVVVGVSA